MDNFNVSRRTVAKGAAWAVPAVAIGSAAQAATCSENPGLIHDCSEFTDKTTFYTQGADLPTLTLKAVGTDNGPTGAKGTHFRAHLGTYQFRKPVVHDANGNVVDASKITGYRVNWKDAFKEDAIRIRTIREDATNGVLGRNIKWVQGPADENGEREWGARFSSAISGGGVMGPNSGPLVIGAGLVYTGTLQTKLPYRFADCGKPRGTKPYQELMMSIPVKISFLRGLKVAGGTPEGGEDPCSGETNACTYYVNYTWKTGALGTCNVYANHQVGAAFSEREIWLSSGLPELPAV